MKSKILGIFSSLMLVLGVIAIIVNSFLLLSGQGKEKGADFAELFDVQVSNKLHVLLIIKAVVLFLAYLLVRIRGAQLIKHERRAQWLTTALLGSAFVFFVCGLAMSFQHEQFRFQRSNASLLWFLRIMVSLLIGVLLVRSSLSLINRKRWSWWAMTSFLTVLVCNDIANIIMVVAYPILIPSLHWWTKWFLRNSVLYLLLETGSLLLLIWLRSEVDEREVITQNTKNKLAPTLVVAGIICILLTPYCFWQASRLQTQMQPMVNEYGKIVRESSKDLSKLAEDPSMITSQLRAEEYRRMVMAQKEREQRAEQLALQISPLKERLNQYESFKWILLGIGVVSIFAFFRLRAVKRREDSSESIFPLEEDQASKP